MTTAEQRAANLDRANQARIDRAKLGFRIKNGEVRASTVLADMPECMGSCGVYIFLTYMPRVGRGGGARSDCERGAKAFVLLRKASVPGHKRLDHLTPAQLERLTRVVAEFEQSKHPSERGLT